MRVKNITCFIASLSSGGAEHQLVELARLLCCKGYVVKIVTFADEADHYDVSASIQRVRLAEGKSKLKKVLTIFFYFLFLKTDCVISYGQRDNVFCLLSLLFRPRVKVIAGERSFTAGKPSIYEKLLISFLYYRAAYIVPNSFSQKKYILTKKPNWKNKVQTIINYTNLEKYAACYLPKNEILHIGIFARYTKGKNYDRFALMVKNLREKTSISFKIDWYGNKNYKNNDLNPEYIKFEKLLKEYGIEDVLHLNNHIKNVIEIIPQFDVICLPTLWEGFSTSIAEGICCGMPMLVSNVSDNGVMVHDGVNGFLFDPTNVDDMCSAFLRFFALTAEERKQMGIESRKIAESLFAGEQFIDSYINLIENKVKNI